ncbi:helix-turn-helix domain-containing protein [Agromyces marinus]|uniref:HTH cro/C1-type domain-containing protein n=1 Tax=Agromyces marinus TaxID=1389020 RepID=A0ABM8GZS6_9MICO|nr:helix-turn-helix transcriptional regulator [Agromyces marinus]UIP57840.1 hypothetical protein DSM26151_07060 [Agromyces marinus]BDZ53975.1 hypothetical protein GCM10025870_10480 [Agromyces marinus]
MGEMIGFPDAAARRRTRPLWRHVLGEVLRDERQDQERILTEVARTAGVSPQYLSEVERGRKEASSEVLGAVGDALGLDLAELATRVASRLAPREPIRSETRRGPVAVPTRMDAPSARPADAYLLAA